MQARNTLPFMLDNFLDVSSYTNLLQSSPNNLRKVMRSIWCFKQFDIHELAKFGKGRGPNISEATSHNSGLIEVRLFRSTDNNAIKFAESLEHQSRW